MSSVDGFSLVRKFPLNNLDVNNISNNFNEDFNTYESNINNFVKNLNDSDPNQWMASPCFGGSPGKLEADRSGASGGVFCPGSTSSISVIISEVSSTVNRFSF